MNTTKKNFDLATLVAQANMSPFSKGIIQHLINASENFTKSVALTVVEPEFRVNKPNKWEDITKATGEMEDFASQVNQGLVSEGFPFEFFSGPGFYENDGKFFPRIVRLQTQKKKCTFWFCQRGAEHKTDKRISVEHGKILALLGAK